MSGKDEWMRLADVAAESKMALSTIYYLHNKGRGPKFSRLGRTVRVKRSDFDEWFEENRQNRKRNGPRWSGDRFERSQTISQNKKKDEG